MISKQKDDIQLELGPLEKGQLGYIGFYKNRCQKVYLMYISVFPPPFYQGGGPPH